ncbi:roadblock/LC7 domain-containing protein [Actinocorallia sp. API 0066]|uniref:roadblock/LC7 domain-containing protein n=1 Tax=Actinocorallia sp. API 0066 TaxID=2896846 RepID=UPI001E46999E|nr:roadblock/LC7 domain-containing protein [Actinocorallia sp. API 0066]MCD0448536.1 roadblock/LC7 domain-containing protein [Actinocorallia sp. API 0066]
MTQTVSDVQSFTWLLANFVRGTDGVADAVAVSSDGLLMARSEGLDRKGAERLAAIVSGMTSLARSASRQYGFDGMKLVMVEMRRGFLLVSSISDGSCLGVVATSQCDLGLVGHEIALLCDRFGALLTPQIVAQLKHEALR